MPPVIEFSHVSKQYLLGAGARSLRSVMATLPKRLLHQPIAAPPVHWALRDLSSGSYTHLQLPTNDLVAI